MFSDEDFLAKLAFLSDLFEKLNILNSSLQGNKATIFQLFNKVEGLKKTSAVEEQLVII